MHFESHLLSCAVWSVCGSRRSINLPQWTCPLCRSFLPHFKGPSDIFCHYLFWHMLIVLITLDLCLKRLCCMLWYFSSFFSFLLSRNKPLLPQWHLSLTDLLFWKRKCTHLYWTCTSNLKSILNKKNFLADNIISIK